jgi:signal transduction histidine kinase/CheY-like chemotaxis protein
MECIKRDINKISHRCILTSELSGESGAVPYIFLPLARCAGAPPADLQQLYLLCLDCDLFHQHADRQLFSTLASYISESNRAASDQKLALDIGHASIRKMLERLSVGDPDARVVLPDDIGIFRELEPLLNQMADFMKEQIDNSHEIAIGLCEHYETLLKLASGDLASRSSINSPIELIAKLGELINLQAKSFQETIDTIQVKEQELASLTRLQHGIIDFLPDATFVIDREHRVIAWNKAMAELSGVPEKDMLGKGDYAYSMAFYSEKRPLLIDLIELDLETVRQYYRNAEKRGASLVTEWGVSSTIHGTRRDLWIAASPLFDQDGSVIGAIESLRDVTDFKKADAERELLKDQLHHAQKLDSVGQLASGIAHEFNNILAAILGYAGILEMRLGSDSPNLAAVHRIISASEKAASLTHGMLAFSRKQVVVLEPISLNSFIYGMEEMLCRLAGENIQFDFYLDPQELTLNADHGQLQQIVLNLYNNARDAMPDGGRLKITTAGRQIAGNEENLPAGMPPGSYVQLTVADSGHGIPPEDMDLIFDPFFTTKEVGKGTGLGLSMVFGIVQQHEGFIKVTSTPGEGTSFSIYFPELTHVSVRYSGNVSVAQNHVERIYETIIVGEDNEDVRPMIVELLQDVGFKVLEARDGAEVVTFMENCGDTVDLLLLDVIMPRMNGYEALSYVRLRYPDLPCLFLSGYSDDIIKQKAKISGEFNYLSKPIMPNMLIEAVQAALDGRKRLSDV